MPVRATSQSATQKWLTNLSAATDRMTQGANSVQKAPGLAAAAAADKWLAKVTASKAKFASRVASVSLQSWQQSYINVGIPRVAQGAQAKQAKVTAFMDQFLPYLSTGLQTIDAMPNTTLEDGIARATAMIRYNAKFQRTAS
jgi:glutaredoxin 2